MPTKDEVFPENGWVASDSEFPVERWQELVAQGTTRQGYREWLRENKTYEFLRRQHGVSEDSEREFREWAKEKDRQNGYDL